jgi:lipopolysaccharide transport system ATP-binding protein
MTTVISIEDVSKYYRLGAIGSGTFADDLSRWWARVRHKPDPLLKVGAKDYGNQEGDFIWALRNINFQVQQGEVLGIIGRNGAGKSTLLKILSRVTAPTSGKIKVKGRIASLLEVGTGFHPELTGRENIYLNGAIFGMNRAEVNRKLDEIIAFSEVEKYIDTPVKRYSSGMYVRLAFAVAAHLEPEILIVDEVLAVGDVAFQKKCLGKMGNVASEGRTVLFVSHNMSAILELCPKAILLNGGKLFDQSDSAKITQQYYKLLRNEINPSYALDRVRRPKNVQYQSKAKLLSCKPIRPNEIQGWDMKFEDPIGFDVEFEIFEHLVALELGIALYIASGFEVFSAVTSDYVPWEQISPGRYKSQVYFPELNLLPGSYKLGIGLRSENRLEDYIPEAAYFDIVPSESGTEKRTRYRKGVFIPKIEVTLQAQ